MKQKEFESVLHDWVHGLTFQMQALLMTGMRGPDGQPKHCTVKPIVRYLRGVVFKPAGDWQGHNDNDFMWGTYLGPVGNDVFNYYAAQFWADHDQYPHHFLMHLIHCAEVVGYMHPDYSGVGVFWHNFYTNACLSMHMAEETREQMCERLNDFK